MDYKNVLISDAEENLYRFIRYLFLCFIVLRMMLSM